MSAAPATRTNNQPQRLDLVELPPTHDAHHRAGGDASARAVTPAPAMLTPAPELIAPPIELAQPAAAAPAPQRKRIILGALLALATIGGTTYWASHRGIEDTDDAQLEGDVVNVPARTGGVVTAVHFKDNQSVKAGNLLAEINPAPAQARLEQTEAELVSAQASAEAADVEAHLAETNARGQQSMARASLRGAEVGVATTSQQIAEADASLAAATANLNKTKLDLQRMQQLVAASAVSQSMLDNAQAAFDSARATVDQARARAAGLRASTGQVQARVNEASARYTQASTVDQQIANARARARVAAARVGTAKATRDLAALDLSYTKIFAPSDGIVSKRVINVGQMVPSGTPIVALVPTTHLWVVGNFKETQLAHMRPGQPATVKIDAFDGLELHGRLESFSAATGARFSLLPPDNATGNFTKVVQRVPVRIALDQVPSGVLLRPGLSVDLAVNTR